MRRWRFLAILAWLCTGMMPGPARADDATDAFHAAMADAYRHYREAAHYAETGNAAMGTIALDDFLAAWSAVIERFGDRKPKGYAADTAFKSSLLSIRRIAEQARQQPEASPEAAARALRPVIDLLASLRRRNGQRVYSDCIDAMNAAMDRLWAWRRRPPRPERPETVIAYKTAGFETALWFRQCRDEAPAALRGNDEFQRLFAGALASLDKLAAVDIAQTDALISILRELRSFDRLIWLRFG